MVEGEFFEWTLDYSDLQAAKVCSYELIFVQKEEPTEDVVLDTPHISIQTTNYTESYFVYGYSVEHVVSNA